ncbi:MAG: Hint domain-containing protein, partial [Terriglobus roseus]|nr:Hint domain-containing protein [Terriglobus roseus]
MFAATLSGNQVLFGNLANSDLMFSPTNPNPSAFDLSVYGTVRVIGDIVDVTLSTQNNTLTGHATYEGFYFVSDEKMYVFHLFTEVPGFGSVFAITENGQPIPLTSGTVRLDTGAVDTCFLRGTMISTARGEIAVEDIAAGDEILVITDDCAVSRPVIWVGRQSVSLDPRRADVDAYPVRIRAGAFREQVPHRDLLVISEHRVFVDNILIPARMLVNGSSITVARDTLTFDYFHVVLAQHGILMAEGLEAESCSSTVSHHTSADGNMPQAAPGEWFTSAKVPMTMDRNHVEPVWHRLAARAEMLDLSSDPMLRLVTRSGMEIAPSLVEGGFYAFVVPGGVDAVRLRSRTSRPSETVGPFVD